MCMHMKYIVSSSVLGTTVGSGIKLTMKANNRTPAKNCKRKQEEQ